jgi:8-oxo-dGTP pyrophosphatase MutT (NUDIX family)
MEAVPIWEAAVALVVQPGPVGPDLLLIRRSERAGDPWSGHMALPGGRRDPGDPDLLQTAVRETREEIGIDPLASGSLLGALDEVTPRGGARGGLVAPFVFAVPAGTRLIPNHEVARTVWIPLLHLYHPAAATTYHHRLPSGATAAFPAFQHDGEVVWGMTYRVLAHFLDVLRAHVEVA